jgi:hypothetical protein
MKRPQFIQMATTVVDLKDVWSYLEDRDIIVEDSLIVKSKDFDVIYDGVAFSIWGDDWEFEIDDEFDVTEEDGSVRKKFVISKELAIAFSEKYGEI